jgi:hypothetical protein
LNNGTVENTYSNGCDFPGENLIEDKRKYTKSVGECVLYCFGISKCMAYLAIDYGDKYFCCLKHAVEGKKEFKIENAQKYADIELYNSTCGLIKRLYFNK